MISQTDMEAARQLLESFGFFELDGWMCNPALGGEAIFRLDMLPKEVDIKWIIDVITITAFNNGSQHGWKNAQKEFVKKLDTLSKEIANT